MKKFLLLLIIASALVACKKEIPVPEYIAAQVYSFPIQNANPNEPNPMYCYIVSVEGDLYCAYHTDPKPDYYQLLWSRIKQFPQNLKDSGKRLPDQAIPYSVIAAIKG